MKNFSSIILRVGLGLVIIWFGWQQASNPSAWIAYLPTFIKNFSISSTSLIYPYTKDLSVWVYLNGWFELVFGALLIIGFYTRIVAFILALHLFNIIFAVGYNEIGVRDFGLFIALLSIFLHEAKNAKMFA